MKSNYAPKSQARSSSKDRLSASGFSHRLARPSVGLTFAALTSNLRPDDLWDFSLVDRLHAPLTRRHY